MLFLGGRKWEKSIKLFSFCYLYYVEWELEIALGVTLNEQQGFVLAPILTNSLGRGKQLIALGSALAAGPFYSPLLPMLTLNHPEQSQSREWGTGEPACHGSY